MNPFYIEDRTEIIEAHIDYDETRFTPDEIMPETQYIDIVSQYEDEYRASVYQVGDEDFANDEERKRVEDLLLEEIINVAEENLVELKKTRPDEIVTKGGWLGTFVAQRRGCSIDYYKDMKWFNTVFYATKEEAVEQMATLRGIGESF